MSTQIPEAERLEMEDPIKIRATRQAYRRVFDPDDGEEATPGDRKLVMEDLREISMYDRPFDVLMGGADLGFQLAVQEGRRTMFLRILKAIKLSRQDINREEQESHRATTE